MAKAVPHSHDQNKFMLNPDLIDSLGESYGHGRGNGKSKQAVYSWIKRQSMKEREPEPEPEPEPAIELDVEPIVSDERPEGDPDEEPVYGDEWQDVDWTRVEDEDVIPDTIGSSVQQMVNAFSGDEQSPSLLRRQRDLQGKIARWGFMTLDRLVTWWGRGVTSDPEYELLRSSKDYDLLEGTTVDVMDYYNISIPLNPLAIWGITVGTAYVPPLADIRRRADPAKKRSLNWRRFIPFLRRRPEWHESRDDDAESGEDLSA
jgi:hypothetical protein